MPSLSARRTTGYHGYHGCYGYHARGKIGDPTWRDWDPLGLGRPDRSVECSKAARPPAISSAHTRTCSCVHKKQCGASPRASRHGTVRCWALCAPRRSRVRTVCSVAPFALRVCPRDPRAHLRESHWAVGGALRGLRRYSGGRGEHVHPRCGYYPRLHGRRPSDRAARRGGRARDGILGQLLAMESGCQLRQVLSFTSHTMVPTGTSIPPSPHQGVVEVQPVGQHGGDPEPRWTTDALFRYLEGCSTAHSSSARLIGASACSARGLTARPGNRRPCAVWRAVVEPFGLPLASASAYRFGCVFIRVPSASR